MSAGHVPDGTSAKAEKNRLTGRWIGSWVSELVVACGLHGEHSPAGTLPLGCVPNAELLTANAPPPHERVYKKKRETNSLDPPLSFLFARDFNELRDGPNGGRVGARHEVESCATVPLGSTRTHVYRTAAVGRNRLTGPESLVEWSRADIT
jgi:hypothetical protein